MHSSGKQTMSAPASEAASQKESILDRFPSMSPVTEFIDTIDSLTSSIISP